MQKCLGPCIAMVSKEEYQEYVQKAKSILQGNSKALQKELEQDMRRAAAELRFEDASRLRDQLHRLQNLGKNQRTELQERPEIARDYLAMLPLQDYYFFTVLILRQGKLLGYHQFSSRYLLDESADIAEDTVKEARHRQTVTAALVEFLCQYYLESGHELPNELHLPDLDLDWKELEIFLQVLRGQRGNDLILCPFSRRRESANDRVLLLWARENAIRQQQLWLRNQGGGLMLEELRKALNLPILPRHIEGFDISHMGGKATVASLIVFRDGVPAKEEYRSFNLRNTEGYIDDTYSIQEAVSRCYTRRLNEAKELPDLIMIDGGLGQVNAAAKILRSLELAIPLVGLAKREEILFFPNLSYQSGVTDTYAQKQKPLKLPAGHTGLKVLQQIRDEAHRKAHGSNRKRYQKQISHSLLENVPGVGKKRSSTLMQQYGSLEAMAQASADELAKAGQMGLNVAETLVEYLGRRKT